MCRSLREYGHILYLNCCRSVHKNLKTVNTTSIRKNNNNYRHPKIFCLTRLTNPNTKKITQVEQRLQTRVKNCKHQQEYERSQPVVLSNGDYRQKCKPAKTIFEVLLNKQETCKHH